MKKQFKDSLFGEAKTMNRAFRQFSMGAVAIAIMQVASAQVSMTNIVPMSLADQGTEIRVMFNGLPPQPQAYQLEQPSRLILDFDKTQQGLKQTSIPVSTNEASSIDIAADDQRSRLVVNLKEAGAFTTRVEGNTFVLKINAAQPVNNSKNVAVARQPQQGVSNIGFQRGAQGEGLVVVDLLGSNTPIDVQQQGSKVVIRTMGNKIPTHLARRLNTNDFATPVASVDAYNDKGNGVITIQSAGSYEYMAYQAENKLTISLKRPDDKSPAKAKSQVYTGNKISLDFQDIEVRRVLQLLADFTSINMVAADTVQGNITLRLKDVPWDQALDIVLKTKNLDKRRNGNVIWIAPVSELIKSEEEEAKAIAQSIKLAPIQTEYIKLSYAKAADVLKLIEESRDSKGAMSNRTSSSDSLALESLLSSRGSAVADTRTNTLIVNDTALNIDKVRKLIDLLDVSVKQVMIEARVVLADTSVSKDLGVRLRALSSRADPGFKDVGDQFGSGNFVNTGVENATNLGYTLFNANSTRLINLQLRALEIENKVRTVSNPRVITSNKEPALIEQGTEIPYQIATSSGATATEFKEANLKLAVTPQIAPDGTVLLDVDVAKDSIGIETSNGPAIDTRRVKTKVLVSDGGTVVLGGIFEEDDNVLNDKTPFLGDIPGLGVLFRGKNESRRRAELLIFLTPVVLTSQ